MNNEQVILQNDKHEEYEKYYVPEQSKWPIIAAASLFVFLTGAGLIMNALKSNSDTWIGYTVLAIGSVSLIYMMFGWFRNVIEESRAGLYSKQMDRTFRWGMFWFIFSEIWLFIAFFGALFFIRVLSVPELAGVNSEELETHKQLWQHFKWQWPLLVNPDNSLFVGPKESVNPYHLPLLNTILLITSSVTLTVAHDYLRKDKRDKTIIWLLATLALGFAFLFFQVLEYHEAYNKLGLTLSSGAYGSTFFILTGFHGAHVTLGAIMLTVMLLRIRKGHFSGENHFGFEAASWYWHFVDVVWVGLFIFVYII